MGKVEIFPGATCLPATRGGQAAYFQPLIRHLSFVIYFTTS